jgi:transposase
MLQSSRTNNLQYSAMNDIDILPQSEGKDIHDGWLGHAKYSCEHFLCNAHYLRQLRYIWEHVEPVLGNPNGLLLCTIKR